MKQSRNDARGWTKGNGAYSSDKSGLTRKALYIENAKKSVEPPKSGDRLAPLAKR